MSTKRYDDDDIQRLGEVMAEYIVSKFQAAIEAIDTIKVQAARIPVIEEDVAELKADMKTVKAAIQHTNRDLQTLERRVTKLEAVV